MSARIASLACHVDVAAPSLWLGLSSTLLPLLLLFCRHCHHCPPPLSVIITPHACPQRWREGGYDANRRRATTSSSSDADNVSQGWCAHHRHHRMSSSSHPPPPAWLPLPPPAFVDCLMSPPWIYFSVRQFQCHRKKFQWRHHPGDCHRRRPSHLRWPSSPHSRIRTPNRRRRHW